MNIWQGAKSKFRLKADCKNYQYVIKYNKIEMMKNQMCFMCKKKDNNCKHCFKGDHDKFIPRFKVRKCVLRRWKK